MPQIVCQINLLSVIIGYHWIWRTSQVSLQDTGNQQLPAYTAKYLHIIVPQKLQNNAQEDLHCMPSLHWLRSEFFTWSTEEVVITPRKKSWRRHALWWEMFWLLFLISFGTSDALPNSVTSRQNVQNTVKPNITKLWFAYINMFLFVMQKQPADTKVYRNNILFRMRSSKLLKLSSQNTEFSSFRNQKIPNVDASISKSISSNCTIPLEISTSHKYLTWIHSTTNWKTNKLPQ